MAFETPSLATPSARGNGHAHAAAQVAPQPLDLVLVAGARPNFVKIAPLYRAIREHGGLTQVLLHTGQHHDFEMSRVFFEELELAPPDLYLGANSGTHAQQTARIMLAFEEFLSAVRPRIVVVVGDVNSTLACSVVAAKAGVPIAHVEAGLRSFDRTMPEEINRIVTDSVSEILYTTCEDGTRNLLREGVDPGRVHEVGNVMIDTLLRHRAAAARLPLPLEDRLARRRYAVATIHRPSNVDIPENLAHIVAILQDSAAQLPVVFPVHPRTHKQLDRLGLSRSLEQAGVHVLPPLGYLAFLRLMLGAAVVLTDSGGIQEETTVLGVPCLTLRRNTERPITVELGTNLVVGTEREPIQTAVRTILSGNWKHGCIPNGWDGHAAERIATHLAQMLAR